MTIIVDVIMALTGHYDDNCWCDLQNLHNSVTNLVDLKAKKIKVDFVVYLNYDCKYISIFKLNLHIFII